MAKISMAREHAERARDLLASISATFGNVGCDQAIAVAQVHATLALVEAQRTANMIAASQAEHTMTDDVYRRVDN